MNITKISFTATRMQDHPAPARAMQSSLTLEAELKGKADADAAVADLAERAEALIDLHMDRFNMPAPEPEKEAGN